MKRIFPGYYIVAASFVIQATYLGAFFSFNVLTPDLAAEFGWERATITAALSINFLVMGVSVVFMGRLTDRLGPRWVLALASIIYGLGYLLLSQVQAVWQLYLFFGILAGISIGAHDVCTLSTVSRWFVERRGLITGIVKSGAGIGQLLFPGIVAWLVFSFGWRTTCVVIGVLLLTMTLVSLVLKRDPAMLGLQPDDRGPLTDTQLISARAQNDKESGISLRDALRTRQLWLLALGKFADFYCLMTIVAHIVWHGEDLGLGEAAAGILVVIGGISILGRLAVGKISDQFGSKRAIQTCFILLFLSFVFLLTIETPKLLFVFALIYGIAHGGFFTATSPSVAEYFGTRSHGAIFGILVFCGTVGGFVSPPLAGYFFDKTGSYDTPFLILTALSIIGFIVISQLRPLTVALDRS